MSQTPSLGRPTRVKSHSQVGAGPRVGASLLGASLLALFSVLGAACGGASSHGSLDAKVAEAPASTPDEAERQLEQAEAELDRVVARGPTGQPGQLPTLPAPERPVQTQAGQPTEPRPAPAEPAAPAAGADRKKDEPSGCELACRALGSMTRSTDRLCALTSAQDARCQAARERTRAASERVQKSCGAC